MSIDFRSMGLEKESQNDLIGAEAIYRKWIENEADSMDAWFRLGVNLLKQNRPVESISCFQRTVALDPQFAEAWCNLGICQAGMQRFPEAERSFKNAVSLNPNRADFLRNLAGVQSEMGIVHSAIEAFQTSLAMEPNHLLSHFRLAILLRRTGQRREAAHHFQKVLMLSPGHVPSMCELGEMLIDAGRYVEAENLLRMAVQTAPNTQRAHSALGILFANQKKYQAAVDAFQQVLQITPRSAVAWSNLGNAYKWLGQTQSAIQAFLNSLEIEPNIPDTWVNLGAAMDHAARFDEAKSAYQKAVELDPHHAVAHHNYALACLRLKQWEVGWNEYEWRWKCEGYQPRCLDLPVWDGRGDRNATILIQSEQGIGDTVQFIRYAKLAKSRCAKIVLECPKSLVPLLSTCEGVDETIAIGSDLPPCDARIPVMSLPRVLSATPDHIPNQCPYLKVDQQRLSHWREVVRAMDGYKIGIVWKGNSKHKLDALRSISLSALSPIAQRKNIRILSLQKDATDEIQGCGYEVIDFNDRLDQDGAAFMDTCALMRCVDLVVSIDSAAAHIAGAVGVPVWLLVPRSPDWRWFTEGTTSPWYPSMRLFRQKDSDWSGVVAEIVAALPF